MRGPCQNGDCDRPNSEYRDEFGVYLCDECYAEAIWETEQQAGRERAEDSADIIAKEGRP